MKRSERMSVFVEEIWEWFGRHKRRLPWRDLALQDDTERGYRVLVSEIMLQQTQVSRVQAAYRNFLDRFPTLASLSRASNKEVLLAWRGMGYNSRALRLRDAARCIETEHSRIFPRSMEALQCIPGVGHYTAAAIRNFAFQMPTPCLDTNIRRILHRTFVGPERADGTWGKSDAYLLRIAGEALEEALKDPVRTTADWHAALMDFGSLVCTKTNPKWGNCPLTRRGICKAAYRVARSSAKKEAREPGRHMGAKFVPNRIFRGRIVDELRDAPSGLPIDEIGRRICMDWSPQEHRQWLDSLLLKLRHEELIAVRKGRFTLAE